MKNKSHSESQIIASEISIFAPHTEIIGNLNLTHETHIYGKILGELIGPAGSRVIVKNGASIEGKITADQIIIEGFMKGDLSANESLKITGHGRVIGNVHANNLCIEPGAIFDGKVIPIGT
jgi:cytoskeletal protein CcmA (bactofilin family)